MNPSHTSRRTKRAVRLAPEALESRALMTGGAGNTFAILPGEVLKPGGSAVVKFTIDPTHFHLPSGKLTLGIDVAPDPTGTLHPAIGGVIAPNGAPVRTVHSVYDRHVTTTQAGLGRGTTAVLAQIQLDPANPTKPVTYEVDVKGVLDSSGKFLLGFYLPGDANGDGTVNAADLTAIRSALNANSTSKNYSFDADANRDGRIGMNDLHVAQLNQGVSLDIAPDVGANLDPAGMLDANQRVSRNPTAHFTGSLTPGASVTYAEVNNKVKPVSTTADAKGHYSITVPLAAGPNTFKVTTMDAFGQSISGTLAPVNYSANPPVANLDSFNASQPNVKVTVNKTS
jgi:hypothetical protein